MINRFNIKCSTCNFIHTLRITLGTDIYQEHSFNCNECGENISVALDIDFEKTVQLDMGSKNVIPAELSHFFRMPTVSFKCLENNELCEEDGLILNLDATFLIPEESLHKEYIFPWMDEVRKIGVINEPNLPMPQANSIIHGIGGEINLKEKMISIKKAFDLTKRKKYELADVEITKFYKYMNLPKQDLGEALFLMTHVLLGQSSFQDIENINEEILKAKKLNSAEFHRFKRDYQDKWSVECLNKFFNIFNDYIKNYEGLIQTYIYARRGVGVEGNYSVSNTDFRKIKMFYGNCYEDLSASFFIPSCINNICKGRKYDEFEKMNLAKYLTINKANRANPFKENDSFSCLYSEFDSTIRNASHHGAMRLSERKEGEIEYRSGDTGGWQKMAYSELSYKCNSIFLCYIKTIFIHLALRS